jgi:hypothetical protein
MQTPVPVVALSVLQEQMLSETIAVACAEARQCSTAHLRCGSVAVDAVDFGLHVAVSVRHADWCFTGQVQAGALQ